MANPVETEEAKRPRRPEYMLTTYDNPFDPFTEWDEWYMWDMTNGYHTPGLLARVSHVSDETSELDQFLAVQRGIDEVVRENVSGMHKKIEKGDHQKEAVVDGVRLPPVDNG